MKSLVFLPLLLISTVVFASVKEECEFLVTPGKVQNVAPLNGGKESYLRILPIQIYDAISVGGDTDCRDHVDTERFIYLKNSEHFDEGEALALRYSYIENNPLVNHRNTESWATIPTGGLLRMNCSQVDRSLPSFEVQIRATLVPTPADGLYHSVVVKKNAEIIERTDALKVNADASLRTYTLGGIVFKVRALANQRHLNAELRLADGSRKRMTCARYE